MKIQHNSVKSHVLVMYQCGTLTGVRHQIRLQSEVSVLQNIEYNGITISDEIDGTLVRAKMNKPRRLC